MWLWGDKVVLNSVGKSRRKPSQPGRYERTQSRGFTTVIKQMILTQVKNTDGVMHLSRKVSAKMVAAGGQAYCAVCLLCMYDFTVWNKHSGLINTNRFGLSSPLIHGIRTSVPDNNSSRSSYPYCNATWLFFLRVLAMSPYAVLPYCCATTYFLIMFLVFCCFYKMRCIWQLQCVNQWWILDRFWQSNVNISSN